MAQTDWKKLVAYSSVSHMGYVILGLASMTPEGIAQYRDLYEREQNRRASAEPTPSPAP